MLVSLLWFVGPYVFSGNSALAAPAAGAGSIYDTPSLASGISLPTDPTLTNILLPNSGVQGGL